jgi:hypothetical protein
MHVQTEVWLTLKIKEQYKIKFINHDVAQLYGNVIFTLSTSSGYPSAHNANPASMFLKHVPSIIQHAPLYIFHITF